MLARCSKCGKPVYFQSGRNGAECGYCYARNQLPDSAAELKPEMVDWKKPLYDEVCKKDELSGAYDWLIILDDYADASQMLERLKAEALEKLRMLESRITSADDSMKAEQIVREIQKLKAALYSPDEFSRALKAAQEKKAELKRKEDQQALSALAYRIACATSVVDIDRGLLHSIEEMLHVPGAAELLASAKEKKEALQWEKDRKDLYILKTAVDSADSVLKINHLIGDIQQIQPCPEKEKILADAYEKRAVLLQREAEAALKAAKKQKRKKFARRILIAALAAGIVCYGFLSYHLFQPNQLEKAKALAADGQYAEAEAAYQPLDRLGLFSNPSVRAQAQDELKALWNQWAERLIEQGDKKTAIEKYEKAANWSAIAAARKAYGEELEAMGLYQEAIEQYKQTYSSDKLPALYAKLTKKALEDKDFELAVSSLSLSDPELLSSFEITEQTIYWLWGETLVSQGRTEEAIKKLRNAGKDAKVLDALRTLYIGLAEEKGRKIIQKWEKEGKKTDSSWFHSFASTGAEFMEIDAQLRYWCLLDDAGIDLVQVYPEGAEVSGLIIPEKTEASEELDMSKPLIFQRKEKAYSISLSDASRDPSGYSLHNPENPSYFTVTLLPELWQRLPKERRAASLQDCSCVIALNLTYQSAGSYYGGYRVRDYVSEMVARQQGKKGPFPKKTMVSYGYFPLFTANMELLAWQYPEDRAMVLQQCQSDANYKASRLKNFNASTVVDWTQHESEAFVSAASLGLSGSFSQKWIDEMLKNYCQKLLETGGE